MSKYQYNVVYADEPGFLEFSVPSPQTVEVVPGSGKKVAKPREHKVSGYMSPADKIAALKAQVTKPQSQADTVESLSKKVGVKVVVAGDPACPESLVGVPFQVESTPHSNVNMFADMFGKAYAKHQAQYLESLWGAEPEPEEKHITSVVGGIVKKTFVPANAYVDAGQYKTWKEAVNAELQAEKFKVTSMPIHAPATVSKPSVKPEGQYLNDRVEAFDFLKSAGNVARYSINVSAYICVECSAILLTDSQIRKLSREELAGLADRLGPLHSKSCSHRVLSEEREAQEELEEALDLIAE